MNDLSLKRTLWIPLVGLLLFVGLTGFAEATGGMVFTYFGGGDAVVIDSVGRIVTAGSSPGLPGFALSRYNSDGSLDTSFGNDELVITDVTDGGVSAKAMAIDRLGRIVVAGVSFGRAEGYYNYHTTDFLLARYNSDGSPDTSFGNGGLAITDISGAGSNDWLSAMAIDSLGRIVVAGSTYTPIPGTATPSSIALARYDSDGTLDNTFGHGGIVTTDIDGRGSGAGGVAIDNVGRIIVAGSSHGGFTLARYNSDGSLDNTFGNANGIGVIANVGDSGGPEWVATMAIHSLGRIVAGGAALTFVGPFRTDSFALVRCNSDGTPDTSFGNGGMVTTQISPDGPGRDDAVAGIVIDRLGRIVAVGVCPTDCGAFHFELARYNSDGSLDSTFGNGGIVNTHFGITNGNNSSNAIAIDSLGRIVVAGSVEDSFDDASALVRYNPDGSLDNTFGDGVPLSVPVVRGLRFGRSIVATEFSYAANFSGDNLTDETFFDVRYTAPGSNDSSVAVNWQKGLAANHSSPAGITSGTWTINGVRAHQIETDHCGNFAPVLAMITVSP